ncbi:insulin-like growth factor-binding protein 3 receptor isoform X2 [Fukomys damarensis]|uniref:insulin-like growth factor-binding protein 3 receptor isoform X2 n=1 Tax=Fukomys damarensis TaxID=885580 RepID=UPI0005401FB3|nr:insulin-like growth factor-binding protein 3 receptor isoform X2 [Fukomys damarensis]
MNFGSQEPGLVRARLLTGRVAPWLTGESLLTSRLSCRSPLLSSTRLSKEPQTLLLPMGSCQAGHSLHLRLAHHPPLLCATLILLLLGLSGLGLGGFLLTHRSDLRSPDVPQDWVSFFRSAGQLNFCPVNGTVTGKSQGFHVVGLLTTLKFEDGSDRNKTKTFQAKIPGSSAAEPVLVTARAATEGTAGTCLYFSAGPGILPSSQPPISCSEEGAGNATLSPRTGEQCIRVWSHEGLVLTPLLTSEELMLCGSRLCGLGSLLLICGLLCCVSTSCFHPCRESHWSRARL